MSEIVKAVLTGVGILVLGQIVVKFFIEPYQNYKMLVGEIATSLIEFFNADSSTQTQDVYFGFLEDIKGMQEGTHKDLTETLIVEQIRSTVEHTAKVKKIYRQQGSQLMGTTNMIPMYGLWAALGSLPTRDKIMEASAKLVILSNSDFSGKNRATEFKAKSIIAKNLKIKSLFKYLDAVSVRNYQP